MNPADFLTEDGFQESYRVAQRSLERAQNHRDSIQHNHYEWHERSSYIHPN